MSKMRRGGKIAAYGSQHQPQASSQSSSSSSSRPVEVSPTIANMLQELHELIKKTQVGVVSRCDIQYDYVIGGT